MSHKALVAAAVAALAILTGCAGSAERPSGAPGGGVPSDAVAGPAPEFGPPQAPPPVEKRDVVKTASMTITVSNPSEAADEAAVIAERVDGRVDSRSEDAGSGTGRAMTSIVLRVPVAKLDEVVRELKGLGTVETATTTAEDVTAQRVDLDARIRALQTSVDRLLAIMRDAGDPDALIRAEDALSERQAELDGLRAQRETLGDQIAYSTVNVSFYAQTIGGPAPEQYNGFLGQVRRGWDAMVEVASGAVMLFGLMLPWLGAVAILGAVIYGLVWWAQRGKTPPTVATGAADDTADEAADAPQRLTPPDAPSPPPSAPAGPPRR